MDGGVEKRKTLLFVSSTPQSIAKPSPGWNKVALLTAVRNSPCSCPFSVSLHPPLAALNSEPRPGSLLAFCNHHPKAVPVYGGFEPSAPGGRCSEGRIGRNREYCKRQRSKTTIFQPAFVAANVMSSRKGNGLEMLTAASYSPLSFAYAQQLPRTRWRLLVRFTNLYINNNGDASRPLIFTIYYAHPPQGGSHIVQAIFHCALAQFHPFARTDFTAGVSPLTSPFLPGQQSGSRRPPRCRW